MKADINLKNSLNTNTHAEDVRAFGDGAAPALQNTGIERDGGVTNIYETPGAYAVAGDHFATADGDDLQSVVSGDQRLISINGRQIGITSAYGVEKRLAISGCDDACITSTDTYLTATVKGSGIQVDEYSTAQVLLNTRTTTFTNLAAVLQFFTSLSIIRYQGIKFADSLEFALRLGDQVIILKESTPAMSISKAFSTAATRNGGLSFRTALVFGGYLVLAGDGGKVASFDGSAWRYPDGTGGGFGPYNDGTAMGAAPNNIYALARYTASNVVYLVAAGSGGKLCSYANGVWKAYNTAGAGLWNNATVIGANDILAMSPISVTTTNYLAVAGAGGRMGSYTVAGGWVVYTAGAGLRSNATLLGANNILTMQAIKTGGGESVLVVAGVGGRIGSQRFTGGAWNTKVYTDASGVDNPTNNATVCGANDINCSAIWMTNDIIFGASGGKVGHWHNYAWYNYNGAGGAGVCINNSVAVGINNIAAIAVFGTTVVLDGQSLVASWDGTNWKNFDGTGIGTGLYGNSTFLATGPAVALVPYSTRLVFVGISLVNSSTVAGLYQAVFTIAGFSPMVVFLEKMSEFSYLYVYRYENNQYIVCLTNNSLGYVLILDPATSNYAQISGRYLCPQISGGKTRHIITIPPLLDGSIFVKALGLIGYNDFVTFSNAIAFPTNPVVANVIDSYALGMNYADFDFTHTALLTTVWHYLPDLSASPIGLSKIYQTNNRTYAKANLVNAYGKITNASGVVSSMPFELRVGYIGGVASMISAAVLDGSSSDCMGSLLTNVGEYDETYMPDFKDDRILYRYNGVFYYTILSKTLTGNVFQKISDNLYKINSISPLNIISLIDEKLHVGSSDYHGQMIFESTAAPSATATNVASVLGGSITTNPLAEGIFSNSIDVGDKLCYITTPTAANIAVIGYRIPYGWQSISEMIATYINDIYAFSTANDGSELVLTDPSNPVYVPDDRLPVAIGFTYSDGSVNTQSQTIFLNENYDGYVIGNEAKGVYASFQLFGTRYLFDGYTIYQASFSGLVLSDIIAIAPATGMQFIASTPTQAYFLSSFDNSIYIFNGGRSLTKFQRMSQMLAIIKGIYSTRDNALLLETATTFIWVRDDVVTQNLKSAAQAGTLRLYDTTGGIVIGNDASTWRYGYAVINSSSVVVPLIWQTSYFGAAGNQKSNLTAFNVRLVSPGKAAQVITGRVDMFDEETHYDQTVQWDVKPSDYSSGGYYQIRVQPNVQKTLGSSLTLTIPAKSILVDVVAEYSDDANAITAGKATR
jgi:hypothetical protein